eukprot:4795116-Pleurochrysis_carterae.AAC.4
MDSGIAYQGRFENYYSHNLAEFLSRGQATSSSVCAEGEKRCSRNCVKACAARATRNVLWRHSATGESGCVQRARRVGRVVFRSPRILTLARVRASMRARARAVDI